MLTSNDVFVTFLFRQTQVLMLTIVDLTYIIKLVNEMDFIYF
jgi:hypothetical protein